MFCVVVVKGNYVSVKTVFLRLGVTWPGERGVTLRLFKRMLFGSKES